MKLEHELKRLYEWSKNELKDLMDFYIRYVYDPDGGFYGEVTRELKPVEGADRALVLNARLLWTFAGAYRVVKDPRYLEMAHHALAYIQKYFVDPVHGGA
jgi:mannobiose 2-epimerase